MFKVDRVIYLNVCVLYCSFVYVHEHIWRSNFEQELQDGDRIKSYIQDLVSLPYDDKVGSIIYEIKIKLVSLA